MSVVIPLGSLPTGDAVTLTRETHTVVEALVAEYGRERVGGVVVDAKDNLGEAAVPLVDEQPAEYEEQREVDRSADRGFGGLRRQIEGVEMMYRQSVVELTPTEQAEANAATFLRERLFPEGSGFLTRPWSEQYGETDLLLTRADDPEVRAALSTLGLTDRFALLHRIHHVYGERMGYTSSRDGSRDRIRNWYEALESYLAAVIALHPRGSELREKLSAPYERFVAAARARRRRAEANAEPTPAPRD